MNATARQLIELLSVRDLVDILAVAVIAYNLMLLIRGTRAVQILLGILVLLATSYLARWFGLRTLEVALQGFVIILPFAVIVIFQTQIRRALASFGKNPLFGFAMQQQQAETGFQEIIIAATTLASRKTGGLIVIERMEGLRDYIENGIELDAVLSFDLLITVFNPTTPLHDGAVIIQQGRIAAAACFMPLSSSAEISRRFGTRHRAAIGITEETDAIAVVVSEETGKISVAIEGQLIEDLDDRELRSLLFRYLVTDLDEPAPTPHVATDAA
jgi:uncharacterized protein (TIGR00159 family)